MDTLYFADEFDNTTHLPDFTVRASSVVRAAAYAPSTGDGARVTEQITLQMLGSASEIEALIRQIGRALVQAERAALTPGGEQIYLVCRVGSGWDAWRSRLLGGQVTLASPGAVQRPAGVQVCQVQITRADWWESAGAPLLLEARNSMGASDGGWLTLANHADSAHANLADLPAANALGDSVQGDLPAPLELVLELADSANTRPVTLIAGESWRQDVALLPAAYPGESGTARGSASAAILADAACAGGQYLSLAWSGSAEQEIWGVDVPASAARILAGYPVRPVLRLQSALTDQKYWYHWAIYSLRGGQEYLCGISPAQYMEPGSQLILGPALHLPPWWVDPSAAYAVPGLRLVLCIQAEGGGTLKLDTLTLMGLEGWRIYHPLSSEPGLGIDDNGLRGTLYTALDSAQTYAADGPGFWLQPGRAHRFTFFALRHDAAQKTAPIDLGMKVWLYYRPRKRVL